MSVIFARGCSAAFALVISAPAAFADLSAEEVWADWQSYLASTGYSINATEAQSSNTLVVTDVAMTMAIPDEEATIGLTLPEIKFVENGDGTVNVLLPQAFPLTFTLMGDGDTVTGELIYSHDGSAMLVSGDANSMTYDYASALLDLALGKINVDGDDLPAGIANVKISMTDVVTKTIMQIGDSRSYDQNLTAAALAYDFGFNDPESDNRVAFNGALQGLDFGGTSIIPMGMDFGDISKLLVSGFAFDGAFTFTGGNSTMSGADRSETFGFETSSQGGKFAVAMGAGQLSYDLSQQGTTFDLHSSDVPFPLSMTMAEYGFKMAMPIVKSDAEQDFSVGVTLRDFAVPEMLWGMVDPTGVLPHDPATLVLDLVGKGTLLFDLLDPKAIESMGSQEPGELNALSIKELLFSAAGANLSGSGDFTFNNDDLDSFDGMPAPSGSVDLKLVGANGLMDRLIQMGLLSDSDAMGARMMMGMLAVPGEGDDTLNSKIEITDDGQVLANGQRIK